MVSERLKNETLSEHKEVEKALNLNKAMVDSQSYLKLLKAFYGFYVPIEKALHHHLDELKSLGLDMVPRFKKNLLEQDMIRLGMNQNDLAQIEQCHELPPLRLIPEMLGLIYVLEGSTLGGQVISRMLREKKIFSEEKSCFHNPYGTQTMPMWLAFKDVLNMSKEEEHEQIIASAKMTFDRLKEWLVESNSKD